MNNLTKLIRPLAFAIAGLLVLGAVGLVYASGREDDEKYHLTAYFTKAIGLFENSDVNILGVPVGTVTEIVPEGTRVRVEMEIDEEFRVVNGPETFAQIVPISVISDRYIQLGPIYQGEGVFLQDGDVLDTDVTQIPAELDDVFKQLKKLLDAIEPGKKGEPGALGALIVQLNRTLKDRERDLQGTLVSGAELTGTLADAERDISGLLVNLDGLFGKLSRRANSMAELNTNFALVMTALAESRSDLEGTLRNLANLTHEVGDVATQHGDRLGRDLRLASNITAAVVKNRASVEESLTWLPVVGEGITAAFHPAPFSDIDVRDNSNARLECELLDPLPPGPIKDELQKFCREQTGEPRSAPPTRTLEEEKKLNCDKGIRKVRRQLRRIERVELPDEALDEILKPMRKQLRRLKKECRKLGAAIQDPGITVDDLPDLPPVQSESPSEGLSGSAAGTHAVGSAERSQWDTFTDWMSGFFGFLGGTS
ncbi:MAG: MCE family protein [Actinomycetota bacterium]|nr:MCE family protein [Actinomycetota bacterium]